MSLCSSKLDRSLDKHRWSGLITWFANVCINLGLCLDHGWYFLPEAGRLTEEIRRRAGLAILTAWKSGASAASLL